MRNIALKLMYVGTAYHGWQIQKNAITVQEALEHGISKVVKHPVRCVGAGRTDAGVHAETYIANFARTVPSPVTGSRWLLTPGCQTILWWYLPGRFQKGLTPSAPV